MATWLRGCTRRILVPTYHAPAVHLAKGRVLPRPRWSSTHLSPPLPTLDDLGLAAGDRVTVAMSGGVDSSLTLQLLANLPLELSVLFMRNWDSLLSESPASDPSPTLSYGAAARSGTHQCEWERDYEDVRRVSAHVGIQPSRIRLVDLSKEYWGRVFEPAVGVWEQGGTPNPDVACNREIKFGALFQHLPPDHFLATGHYARVRRGRHGATLHRALDLNKDQTYYLSQIREAQLARAVFPLAGLLKPQVRNLATHYRLPTAAREESMGVCFIGERGRFGDFVAQYTTPEERAGSLVTPAGVRLGTHKGTWYYTIGQRARLPGMDGRWFVARKNVGSGNDILVVPGSDHPALMCAELSAMSFHWIAGGPPPAMQQGGPMSVLVQVRHRMSPVSAQAHVMSDGRVSVRFDRPLAAVAPGQIAGLWAGDQCLGSGTIDTTVCMDEVDS